MGNIFTKKRTFLQEYTKLQERQGRDIITDRLYGNSREVTENECCVCMESDYLMAAPICCQSKSENPDRICSKCLAGGLNRKHIHRPNSHDYMTWECPLCRTVNEEKVFKRTREYPIHKIAHIKEMKYLRKPPSSRTRRKLTVRWPTIFDPSSYRWNCIDCKKDTNNPHIIGHFSASVLVAFCKECVQKKSRNLTL